MKKLLLSAAFLVAVFAVSNAQSEASGFRFGVGVSLALPIGDFGDAYSFGIGGEAQGEYMFTEKVSAVLNSGYTSFIGKSINIGGSSFKVPAVGVVPILAGVRVYPAEQFFIGARAGLGILTGSGSSTSAFQYRPEIGYNGPVQIALSFNGLSKNGASTNFLGLTALYVFGAK
jgi:hypothetical protein